MERERFAMRKRLEKLRTSMDNAKNFIDKVRKFTDMTELIPELFRTFAATIIMYKKEVKHTKHAPQKIQICFPDFILNEKDDMLLCKETTEKADSATTLPASSRGTLQDTLIRSSGTPALFCYGTVIEQTGPGID